jgi:hypothetical protein
VAQLLHDLDYSLQSNRKTEEGGDHPDREAQFRHINNAAKRYLAGGWPVISVDTKKKELIGNYHNAVQFKAQSLKATPPTTSEGIERYLGGGFVKGVGPVLAKKLVGHFGDEGIEGNRLKTLKRQMYGRAGVELLRARMLPDTFVIPEALHQT